MNKLAALASIILSIGAFADVKIEKVFNGEFVDKHYTLFLDDGKVVHVKDSNKELVKELKRAHRKQLRFDYELTPNTPTDTINRAYNFIAHDKNESLSPVKLNFFEDDRKNPLDEANLTVFKTYDNAKELMDTFNGETHEDSQCYNRATLWTYEANHYHNVNLGRIWIFFTKAYIREYNHKWWFHVAPIAKVDDAMETYVLDRGFTMIPFNVENWKNLFIKSQRACPVITDYTDYRDNQREEHCYILYSNQYFYQPYQLRKYVNRRRYRIPQYSESYLKSAYENALIEWDGVVPGL